MDNLDPITFYFEMPLYTPIMINEENRSKFVHLVCYSDTIDAYNATLKENTTYKIDSFYSNFWRTNASFDFAKIGGKAISTATCVRTNEVLFFYASYSPLTGIFQKIGQFPSIADLHISKIRDYDKVLNKEKLKEFTKSIGLAANGVGIGSFVYLRRIFEDLIEEAFQKAKTDGAIDESQFGKLRMADKIESLKYYLPEFLIENKSLYSILSLGIHELKEDECLEYFETVKVGIELILDEKIEKYEKKRKIEEAKKRISSVTSKIKKTD